MSINSVEIFRENIGKFSENTNNIWKNGESKKINRKTFSNLCLHASF